MALPFLLFTLLLITVLTFAANFPNVTYHRCYDGDTTTLNTTGAHMLFGKQILRKCMQTAAWKDGEIAYY